MELPANSRETNLGFRPAAITVAMTDKENAAKVALDQCLACGDCATGCNHNAKDSLDLNLLVEAKRKGAEIYTGATVLKIEKIQLQGEEGWQLHTGYTKESLQRNQGDPVLIKTRKLILAAGTLGSTELLLKSQSNALRFSAELGNKFSGNGDMIAAGYQQKSQVNAIADERSGPQDRAIGPTITGVIDLRHRGGSLKQKTTQQADVLIEEMAVPGALKRIFAEMFATANTLHELSTPDFSRHYHARPTPDPFSANDEVLAHTSIFAVMGDDGAQGRIRLNRDADALE